MKTRKVFWLMGLTILVVMGWNSLAIGQDAMENRQAIEAIVNDFITSCEIKAGMKESQSEALQRTAALAVMKQAYVRNFKEQLLDEMVAAGVEPKPYQVHYHLNNRFFDAIRPQTVARR